MFGFNPKRNMIELTKEASAYTDLVYAEASGRKKTASSSGAQYSCRDAYDGNSVLRLMANFSATNDRMRALRDLEFYSDRTFVNCLIDYMNQKQLTSSAVYKAALLDRRLFSKIVSDENYKPSRDTALALVLALKLPLFDADEMLVRAGYKLSHSSKRDIIIEYFIQKKIYDLTVINEVLDRLDQKVIGR